MWGRSPVHGALLETHGPSPELVGLVGSMLAIKHRRFEKPPGLVRTLRMTENDPEG